MLMCILDPVSLAHCQNAWFRVLQKKFTRLPSGASEFQNHLPNHKINLPAAILYLIFKMYTMSLAHMGQ